VIETVPASTSVVSIYLEPPLSQPEPVLVPWAPPPMLVEAPPMMPFPGAVWIGGFWTWHGNWVWAAGRWVATPQPNYVWVQPYYEHRDAAVVFVNGYWAAPGVVFVPPPPTLYIRFVEVGRGVVPGPRPIGPMGVFVPPPPGSRPGIIVPAPIGTAPAVMMSAPAVMNVGMRVQNNVNTTINNVNNTRVTNITNVTNVTNVTVVAPATATASGQAYQANVPTQAHLAAAVPPVAHQAQAPVPLSKSAIPAYVPGKPLAALPPAQVLHNTPTPSAAAFPVPVPVSAAVVAHPVPAALPLARTGVPEESHRPASFEASPSNALPKPQEPIVPARPAVVSVPPPSLPVPVARSETQPQTQRAVNPDHATLDKTGSEKPVAAVAKADKPANGKPTHVESKEEKEKRLKKEKEELERRAKG
jgi:hypothetical protein